MLIPELMMIVISILSVWALVSGGFCIALCLAAKRSMPFMTALQDEDESRAQETCHNELAHATALSTVH